MIAHNGKSKIYSASSMSGLSPFHKVSHHHSSLIPTSEEMKQIHNEEYERLLRHSHLVKHKEDINQFAEVKLMNAPLDHLKEEVRQFKEVIAFKEDRMEG